MMVNSIQTTFCFAGIKTKEFPADPSGQNARAFEIVREIVKKVLNRDEEFTITVRKTSQLRYAKDSALILVPPIEVSKDTNFLILFYSKVII
jgi:hypothetical protein